MTTTVTVKTTDRRAFVYKRWHTEHHTDHECFELEPNTSSDFHVHDGVSFEVHEAAQAAEPEPVEEAPKETEE